MFEFYKELNGYAFGFAIDGSDMWHGFNVLSLDADGKRAIEVDRRAPRDRARR